MATGWGVIPSQLLSLGGDGSQGTSTAQQSLMHRMSQPDAREKQNIKQEDELRLPNQDYEYNLRKYFLQQAREGVDRNIMQWFMQNQGKLPDAETQKAWNQELFQIRDAEYRLESYNKAYLQGYKDYAAIDAKLNDDPLRGTGLALTNKDGVWVVYKDDNNRWLTERDVLEYSGNVAGTEKDISGREHLKRFSYPALYGYTGTADKYFEDILSKASDQSYVGSRNTEVGDENVRYIRTIMTESNEASVMRAASSLMARMTPQHEADLMRRFHESLQESGLNDKGELVIPFEFPSGTYEGIEVTLNEEDNKVIKKYLRGDGLDSREYGTLRKVQRDYMRTYILNVANANVSYKDQYKDIKTFDRGTGEGGMKLDTWTRFAMGIAPESHTTLSMIGSEQQRNPNSPVNMFENKWIEEMASIEKEKGYHELSEAEQLSYLKLRKAKLANNLFKGYPPGTAEKVLKANATAIDVAEYPFTPDDVRESGILGASLVGNDIWSPGSNMPQRLTQDKMTKPATIVDIKSGYRAPGLFGKGNDHMLKVTAIVHEDDLKNFSMLNEKGERVNYEDLYDDDYPYRSNYVRRYDEAFEEVASNMLKIYGSSNVTDENMSMMQIYDDDKKNWYLITTYVVNDTWVTSAANKVGDHKFDPSKTFSRVNPEDVIRTSK